MPEFKPGDTVRMKSGGPVMTVHSIQREGDVWCEWFDSKQTHQQNGFKPTSLEKEGGQDGGG